MSGDKVVHLAFRSEKVNTEWREDVACKGCRNKTFVLTYDEPAEKQGFPMLRCACCGTNLGRMGWTPEDEA